MMKQLSIFLPLFVFIAVQSCIGKDFIDDEVSPEVRILNPVDQIAVSETYQFNATYFNRVGQAEITNISWSSSVESVATIDANGLLTGISEGQTIIKAIVLLNNNSSVEAETTVTIVMGDVQQNTTTKSGSIATTSSYELTGDFTLQTIENTTNLRLSLANNYKASTSLPGLYVYLTNNPNSIASARSLGAVSVFEGAHSYTIENVGINDFSYLLYWCEPFGVKVGGGNIND
ncbi:Ig-like domain-containing protein [Geojedonia litorea]|uniref:Ig-like domain-containing protein n=1 Tax=Geojedonia litorea TaxID=1268269 RepID=A0ABV9N645_9FLAO